MFRVASMVAGLEFRVGVERFGGWVFRVPSAHLGEFGNESPKGSRHVVLNLVDLAPNTMLLYQPY